MFELCPFTEQEWAERGGKRGANCKKRAVLGKGAFAITYRVVGRAEASGVKAGQRYAVKTINAETLDDHSMDISSVNKEVEVLTTLAHPHIVKFIKFMSETRQCTEDGEVSEVLEHHLIMELAEGGSLAAVIKATPGPEAAQVVTTPSTVLPKSSHSRTEIQSQNRNPVTAGIWFLTCARCFPPHSFAQGLRARSSSKLGNAST